jgi:hypothetical protein
MTLPVPGYRRPSISSRWHRPHISEVDPGYETGGDARVLLL